MHMTQAELEYYTLVPRYLRTITETLKVIANSLDKKDNETNEETGSSGDLRTSG